jgi:hypothetical protein
MRFRNVLPALYMLRFQLKTPHLPAHLVLMRSLAPMIHLTNLTDYAYIDTMATAGPAEAPGKSGIPQITFAALVLQSANVAIRSIS